MEVRKQPLNALRTVTYVDVGDYRIWIGAYNPMDVYAQILCAFAAERCRAVLADVTVNEAEHWMLDNVEGAAEIIEAKRQGRLRPLTGPNEFPIRGPAAFIEGPITHAIRESLSPAAGGRVPPPAGGQAGQPTHVSGNHPGPDRPGGCGCS